MHGYWHTLNKQLTLQIQLTLAFAAINNLTTSPKPLAEVI